MQPISSINYQVFVNQDRPVVKPSSIQKEVEAASDNKTYNTQKINADFKAFEDNEALFSRGNAYADIAAKTQKQLNAYETVALANKRDAVKQMFGVDLFA